MKYTVVLEREPDGGFVASVPLLPGCVSQGDNRDEAITNIREAIELYVEDCRSAGDPIPQEDSREYVELRTGTRQRKPPSDLSGAALRQALERIGFVFPRPKGKSHDSPKK